MHLDLLHLQVNFLEPSLGAFGTWITIAFLGSGGEGFLDSAFGLAWLRVLVGLATTTFSGFSIF